MNLCIRRIDSMIVKRSGTAAQVLGLFNASTMDAVNYVHRDPPALCRIWEFVALPVLFVVMAAWLGDAGIVLFVALALAYLLTASSSRAIKRALWRARVERASRRSCS